MRGSQGTAARHKPRLVPQPAAGHTVSDYLRRRRDSHLGRSGDRGKVESEGRREHGALSKPATLRTATWIEFFDLPCLVDSPTLSPFSASVVIGRLLPIGWLDPAGSL